jgi:(p)ppGpp synthase/HD superfamily hydrolase
MSTLERAIEIAATAHAGQQDKAGAPYILHPLRVMLAQKQPAQRIAAILHDVVEDTPWTLEQLRAEGFSDDVLSAVDALTKREGEDYFAFVDRAGRDPVARAVKIADIRDNMDVSRIAGVTDRDRERLEKYRQALTRLGAD